MAEILSEDKQAIINEEILTQIREDKTRRIENDTNTDTIKIFLPKAWTLEYEIANSRLYKLLSTAIDAAHQEEIHPEQEITDEIIMELWNEVNAHYPDGHSTTPKDVYEIFRPLNEGTVSKAVTAQYLAGMIAGDLPPVSNGIIDKNAIKEMIETDENLRYLVNAILHVTN
jgi:putative ATP-dependent endonuclease of OLD family